MLYYYLTNDSKLNIMTHLVFGTDLAFIETSIIFLQVPKNKKNWFDFEQGWLGPGLRTGHGSQLLVEVD